MIRRRRIQSNFTTASSCMSQSPSHVFLSFPQFIPLSFIHPLSHPCPRPHPLPQSNQTLPETDSASSPCPNRHRPSRPTLQRPHTQNSPHCSPSARASLPTLRVPYCSCASTAFPRGHDGYRHAPSSPSTRRSRSSWRWSRSRLRWTPRSRCCGGGGRSRWRSLRG